MTHTLLERLLNAPDLSLLVNQVNIRLTEEAKRRQEFREWITPAVKAEFINGEVVLHSPVKRGHLKSSGNLFKLLDTFVAINDLGETSYDKGMIALTRNDYEPEVCFWGKEKSADFTDDTMLHPVPDFVAEVLSRKTAKTDRTTKFQDYAAHGIPEYWIIDPIKKTIEQYWLHTTPANQYVLVDKWVIGDRITASSVPGFSIMVEAIFDTAASLAALRTLLNS